MNYLEKLSNCYPESQAYILGNKDPNIYSNLIWSTTQIPQATLDSAVSIVQSNDIITSSANPIFSNTFSYNGSTSNRWLSLSNGINTDKTPLVLPWDSRLIGISYSNEKVTNIDIEIHKAPYNDASSDILNLTWEIRNTRLGYKTDILSNMTYDAGDKIGIFLKKFNNDKPQNSVVILYFQILETSSLGEDVQNFTGNF